MRMIEVAENKLVQEWEVQLPMNNLPFDVDVIIPVI